MAGIKSNNAKFLLGVRDELSGSLVNLKFSKNGVIQMKDPNTAVKRPGQYQKRRA